VPACVPSLSVSLRVRVLCLSLCCVCVCARPAWRQGGRPGAFSCLSLSLCLSVCWCCFGDGTRGPHDPWSIPRLLQRKRVKTECGEYCGGCVGWGWCGCVYSSAPCACACLYLSVVVVVVVAWLVAARHSTVNPSLTHSLSHSVTDSTHTHTHTHNSIPRWTYAFNSVYRHDTHLVVDGWIHPDPPLHVLWWY